MAAVLSLDEVRWNLSDPERHEYQNVLDRVYYELTTTSKLEECCMLADVMGNAAMIVCARSRRPKSRDVFEQKVDELLGRVKAAFLEDWDTWTPE